MRQNDQKLKDLVLYILSNYNNQKLTETKLQKLLYFCDFDYYQKCNRSITGFSYHKNHFGPTIKTLPQVIDELENEGLIKRTKNKNSFGTSQTNFSVLTFVDTKFDDSEKLVIDTVNQNYLGLSAKQISTLSHQDPPYIVAEDQGIIDYDSVVYRADNGEADTIDEDAKKYFEKARIRELLISK